MLRQLEQRRQFVRGGRAGGGPRRAAAAPPKAAASGSAFGNTGGQGGTGTTARLAPASSIIYTAQLTVRAGDVSSAAAQAAQIADGVGGYVSSETAKVNPDHPSEATASVQLKIPVAAYPATLGQLGHRLGTQLALQQQAQDVTQQVADVDSQVASDQAAIAQLRALLSHAGSVGDLLSVQNQINSEESNLESMQAQQRALSHETSYATVTLTILGPKAKPVLHRPKAPPTLAGRLRRGLARAARRRVLDAGVPRRHRAVRRRPGRRRVRGLPRAALAGPSQAGRRARLAGKLAGGGIQDRARADSACTRSASLASTSGSVSGSTP